jgi:hypothetical protein
MRAPGVGDPVLEVPPARLGGGGNPGEDGDDGRRGPERVVAGENGVVEVGGDDDRHAAILSDPDSDARA